MPLIRIENWSQQINMRGLALDLRGACVHAGVPGIAATSDITVVAGHEQILGDDRTLVILVECLLDKPERTKMIRDHLAQRLASAAIPHAPFNWKIEVFVKRFNREKDSYAEESSFPQ